jgi:two-component system response regulator DesR
VSEAGHPTASIDPGWEASVIRILLVEPMNLLRGALSATLSLEEDFTVVAELSSLDEALGMARAVPPDVAIVNAGLLGGDGPHLLARFNAEQPRCATMMLAGRDRTVRSLDVHVRGLIGTQAAPRELVRGIRRVAGGERVIDTRLVAVRCSPLSEREADVLRVAGSGVPSAEVAATLHLAAGTVRNYISAILRKTGARNRLEAVRVAEAAGWLQ